MNSYGKLINNDALINEVKSNRLLYDCQCPDYKDGLKKEKIWKSIAARFGVDKDIIKKRWKCLRDNYSRINRKQSRRSAYEAHTSRGRKGWSLPFCEKMKFIDNCNLSRYVRPITSNIGRSMQHILDQGETSYLIKMDDDSQNKFKTYDESLDHHFSKQTSSTEVEEYNNAHSSFSDTQYSPMIMKIETVDVNDESPDCPNNDQLMQPTHSPICPSQHCLEPTSNHSYEPPRLSSQTNPLSSERTENDLFGDFVGAELKTMTNYQQSLARLKIQEILFHIKFGGNTSAF